MEPSDLPFIDMVGLEPRSLEHCADLEWCKFSVEPGELMSGQGCSLFDTLSCLRAG